MTSRCPHNGDSINGDNGSRSRQPSTESIYLQITASTVPHSGAKYSCFVFTRQTLGVFRLASFPAQTLSNEFITFCISIFPGDKKAECFNLFINFQLFVTIMTGFTYDIRCVKP